MQIDPKITASVTAIAFKIFIMAAEALQPPSEDCSYWTGFAYDFIQRAASNGSKVGQRKPKIAVQNTQDAPSHLLTKI
jgi:hypothetical protein